jgi:hypothetical protein
MREAGSEGLGSFHEAAARSNRRFDGKRAAAERAKQEAEAWRSAVTEYRDKWASGISLRDGNNVQKWWDIDKLGDSAADGPDKALRRQTRLKSQLPWGMTLRTEMSREAALTAAAIGGHKQTLSGKLKDAANELASRGGVGGALGGIGRFAVANPMMTLGGIAIRFYEREVLLEV